MKTVEFLIVGNGLAGTMLAFEMLEKKIGFPNCCFTAKIPGIRNCRWILNA